MSHTLDQILPSLQSLGLLTYWIIALVAMLEAIVLTGIIAPGGLVVIAGGMLAQRGTVKFFDMAWFVAAGAIIGSGISFYLGQLTTEGLAKAEVIRHVAPCAAGYGAGSALRRIRHGDWPILRADVRACPVCSRHGWHVAPQVLAVECRQCRALCSDLAGDRVFFRSRHWRAGCVGPTDISVQRRHAAGAGVAVVHHAPPATGTALAGRHRTIHRSRHFKQTVGSGPRPSVSSA
ncbi:hypothetical protein SAMN05444339_12513 [Loktanella atrilutea]|uniref:Membrane protein DedA, SNARE-associated domain n=1 Tax=Loktanella atrilutea TaxID=366533 RepID=A0A1M5FTA7_LOKAT|nr:hypothetical protein SAMN05444339_12513 [Loktanella atrilutea]